ncbi:MAG: diguanylate cyclase [Deltaproteobacteria bacterium]|nr:diguanylate cyclase [Deltaproteobacteria bacterium]
MLRRLESSAGRGWGWQALMGRLLVVDDDAGFIEQMGQLGRHHLIDVIPAKNGDEALALGGDIVDGAIINVRLEAEDGFEVARRLRAHDPSLPLAFVASDEDLSIRAAAAHAGAMLFVCKPVSPEQFLETARTLLQEGRREVPRVLFIEDDPEVARYISGILDAAGFRTLLAESKQPIFESMERLCPDVLIIGSVHGVINAPDLCRVIQTTRPWRHLPVVFIAAEAQQETTLGAFEAGGVDHLSRSVAPEMLVARLRACVRSRLEAESCGRCPVSGLPLRRSFIDTLAARIEEAKRSRGMLSVALIDLDDFKSVNDRFGHLMGDQVIQAMGSLLNCRFRSYDLRSRWGGEEFALAFPGESARVCRRLIEEVLFEFSDLNFGEEPTTFNVTFTTGIASLPQDGESIRELIASADRRLYRGKRAGKARVVWRTQRHTNEVEPLRGTPQRR